jgi:cytochrome c553
MSFWTKALIAATVCGWSAGLSLAAAEFTAEQLDFFEKKVRPLLAENCYKCHSVTSEKVKGGLYLDSREAVLRGGDAGVVVMVGDPGKSLLIKAVEYTDPEMQMPPKKQLASAQVEDLRQWVKQGLPWPQEAAPKVAGKVEAFDLEKRRTEHWAWQPIQKPALPKVKDAQWGSLPIDRFILAKLEAEGLKPAPAAEKRTLARRLYFDLLGLPPTPEQVEAFVQDTSPKATEKLVDQLLASPHFGERWGRHWLDMVRYAETMGHEFDYPIQNAWRYRDYVIRAFNADVPYDQFVKEHLAGDLLKNPRINPADGLNESTIGTTSFWLPQQKHSPVDIRLEQAELIDNQIDVISKTFMGMTVSCARCHDHKFDAISAKDYYSLYGIIESSRYRLADISDTREAVAKAQELVRIREQMKVRLSETVKPEKLRFADYIQAASDVKAGRLPAVKQGGAEAEVFADFEGKDFAGWTVTGDAFGEGPVTQSEIGSYQGDVRAVGHGFVNSHNVKRGGEISRNDKLTGRMLSPAFTIKKRFVHFLVGGGAHVRRTCVNLLVDGKAVLSVTGKNSNAMGPARFEVAEFAGKEAQLEIVDLEKRGWGNIGVDHIVFTDRESYFDQNNQPVTNEDAVATLAMSRGLETESLKRWVAALQAGVQTESVTLTAGDIDFMRAGASLPDGWRADGVAFASHLEKNLGFMPGSVEGAPIERLVVPTAFNSAVGSKRLQGALRSPAFVIEKDFMHFLAAGEDARINIVVDGFTIIRNPIYGQLKQPINSPEARWLAVDVSMWKGHRAYLELMDRTAADPADTYKPGGYDREAWLSLERVVFSDARELKKADASKMALSAERDGAMAGKLTDALVHWLKGESLSAVQSTWLNWLVSNQLVDWKTEGDTVLASLLKQHKLIEKTIAEVVTVPAMTEGTPYNEQVFLRGSPRRLGEVVQRRNLEALGGGESAIFDEGSGRLRLAEEWTSPANPLLARVLVNKLWHHLMGRGIVPTVDNFGVLGQTPSHPELLDWLADDFRTHGWSVKRMIKEIVLSRTYQMASQPDDAMAEAKDANNILWHRANVKRLEGEAIRDAVLAVSGRLDKTLYGPSVPIHLTEFMDGRGRPGRNGPLDGDGRRSLYVEIRRNFLSPMMQAFDAPNAATTVGRRTVSNVPAQALIMMNDPFVVQQAKLWAERLLKQGMSAETRVERVYETAFGRPVTKMERVEALTFLKQQGAEYGLSGEVWRQDARVWTDFCHVIFNVKEFVFVN